MNTRDRINLFVICINHRDIDRTWSADMVYYVGFRAGPSSAAALLGSVKVRLNRTTHKL